MPSEYENVVYYESTIVVEEKFSLAPLTSNNSILNIALRNGFTVKINYMADHHGLVRTSKSFQPLRVATDQIINELRAAKFLVCLIKIAAIVYEETF